MSAETHFSGLTDPLYNATQDYGRCRCGSVARVASGLCVSCLLRNGLEIAEEPPVEDFDALLASINIPDRDWQLGNYRILEEIGRGGMGVIYRARHCPSQRVVALKRILNYHSDSRETLIRFQREAHAAASLDHPNILPIFDVGATEDGLPFFSMKLASGGSLVHLRNAFRESPRLAVQLVAKVSRAVAYAHGQGILHRDLKPGNILLDARGEPMVSDFGLAKWLDTSNELTRTLTVFGTPGYIAPEQVENSLAELAPTTDVYSLGAILFELLSGRPPFLGEHALAVIRQAADTDAPKLRGIIPRASRDLETICARCLERDPQMRYQSAGALAEELESWLKGRPIKSRPASPLARLYRWGRRNPVLAASAAICLVCAVTIVTRQVQSRKLENKIRETDLIKNSVAVLPFLDLDSAIEEPKWTAKLGAELQAALSGIGTARLVPLGTAADVKTAARESRTRSVLFGTRRKTDHGSEVSIQLVSADGDVLFDRLVELNDSSDLKPLTHDLAPAIFAVLAASDWRPLIAAKSDPGIRNEQAHELLTAGRELYFHYTVRDLDRAISCFEKAIQIEPRSALAHAYLASAAAGRTYYLVDPILLASAKREVDEAARLAPNSSEVLRILAGVKFQQGQFRAALKSGLRAMELSAPDGRSAAMLGLIYGELGQSDQALRWSELAKRLHSQPAEYDRQVGDCWAALDDYDRARSCYQRANDLHPDRSEGLLGLAHLCLLSSDFAQARTICRKSASSNSEEIENVQLAAQIELFARNFGEAQRLYALLEQKNAGGGESFYGDISYKSALGRLNKNAATRTRLLQVCLTQEIKQLEFAPENPGILYGIAAIEASLGRNESAVTHLQSAISAGWIDYRSLSLDPRFDNIADDVRFETSIGKLKLKIEDLRKTVKNLYKTEPK